MKKLLIIATLVLTLSAVFSAFADSSSSDTAVSAVQGCPGFGGSC